VRNPPTGKTGWPSTRRKSPFRSRGPFTWFAGGQVLALGLALSGCQGETTTLVAAVDRVEVLPRTGSVQVGSTMQLNVEVRGATAVLTGRTVDWSSSNPERATVNSSGTVTGVSAGTVTITAMSEGQMGSAAISVLPPPVASVTLSPLSSSVAVGASLQLAATLRDAAGNVLTGRTVTWSASNARATVNSTGLVSAISTGTVTITATSEGRTGTAAITVTPAPVASVTVSPASGSVSVGGTIQLTATLRDAAGNTLTGRTVNWSSSNTARATVNSSGRVTGIAQGSVTITATGEGRTSSASITVTPAPVASVALSPTSGSVAVGGTLQLSATPLDAAGNELVGRTVTWSSSNTARATVNTSGLVTGVSTGAVTIRATSEGRTASASLTVSQASVASVTVAPSTGSVTVGGTLQLAATLRDAAGNVLSGRSVSWSSSNTSRATVTSSGLVTGLSTGTVTITATSEGRSGAATLTVTQPSGSNLFFLHSNGVTILCPNAAVGSSGIVNGITYTKRNSTQLNSNNAAQACTSGITDLSGHFLNASDFNEDISSWDVSSVVNMREMFYGATSFNRDISHWDVSSVTSMSRMFWGAAAFNQPIGGWNVGAVESMTSMFALAESFNQPIGRWNVASLRFASGMFSHAAAFNQNIEDWDVSRVRSMDSMFAFASSFNQPIGGWDVSSVTNMNSMLNHASAFNQPLSNWNVSNVTNMNWLFWNATSFDHPIGNWDVGSVSTMRWMFGDASRFDQDIGAWDVGNVNDMRWMFEDATSFNRDLGGWCVSRIFVPPEGFDSGATAWTRARPRWGNCPSGQ